MNVLPEPDRVFISYRREEAAAQAGRLYDRLSDLFGEDRVFMDVDSIGLGLDFEEALQRAVESCEIMLALIGDSWLVMTDDNGRRRIDDPHDYVRLEIHAALKRNVRVVPILINGARLPTAEELPNELSTLARRQALALDDTTFRSDVNRLLDQIARVLPRQPNTSGQTVTKREGWTAELIRKTFREVTLRITLNRETHLIAYKVRFLDIVELDGKIVKRCYNMPVDTGVELVLSDQNHSVPAVLRPKSMAGGLGIAGASLTIGDQLVYDN